MNDKVANLWADRLDSDRPLMPWSSFDNDTLTDLLIKLRQERNLLSRKCQDVEMVLQDRMRRDNLLKLDLADHKLSIKPKVFRQTNDLISKLRELIDETTNGSMPTIEIIQKNRAKRRKKINQNINDSGLVFLFVL